jgi:hypothetical protein
VAALTIGVQLLVGGLMNQAYGAYVVMLRDDFGWSKTSLSAAFSMARFNLTVETRFESKRTMVVRSVRLTCESTTPGIRFSSDRIPLAQPSQCIPWTRKRLVMEADRMSSDMAEGFPRAAAMNRTIGEDHFIEVRSA